MEVVIDWGLLGLTYTCDVSCVKLLCNSTGAMQVGRRTSLSHVFHVTLCMFACNCHGNHQNAVMPCNVVPPIDQSECIYIIIPVHDDDRRTYS
jgi:hypothetical protein